MFGFFLPEPFDTASWLLVGVVALLDAFGLEVTVTAIPWRIHPL